MFARPFHPGRFLRSVHGTEPFIAFCRDRSIPFAQDPGIPPRPGDVERWTRALAQLPSPQQARVELELSQVNELSGRDGVRHLLEAAEEGIGLPPEGIPDGAPLALWFFLHHPDFFREVLLQHEVRGTGAWQCAQARPGLTLDRLDERAAALADGLRAFFRAGQGSGRFGAVDAARLREAYCFRAHLADRLRLLDVFTEAGERTTQRLRPAVRLLFTYYPDDGTVLFTAPLRARHRLTALVQAFGRSALGTGLDANCLRHPFNLEVLKGGFRPLPDAPDMELVRVKALHLRYPARARRRQVKLETLASDGPAAIDELIRTHLPGGYLLDQLQVAHAELQVRLRVEGRGKNYAIRLWPDRCSLNQTPLADRFRGCLKRWGIYHVG